METNFYYFKFCLNFIGISTNDSYKLTSEKSSSIQNLNEQKLQKLQADLKRYQMRMDNEGFRKSASPDVQQKHAKKVGIIYTI